MTTGEHDVVEALKSLDSRLKVSTSHSNQAVYFSCVRQNGQLKVLLTFEQFTY